MSSLDELPGSQSRAQDALNQFLFRPRSEPAAGTDFSVAILTQVFQHVAIAITIAYRTLHSIVHCDTRARLTTLLRAL